MKKSIAFLMAVLLLSTLLTGCGTKAENQPQPENELTDPENGTEDPTREPAEQPNNGTNSGAINGTASTLSDAYTAFSDIKYIVFDRITTSLAESEEGAMTSLELLGVSLLDLLLIPLAMMGMDEVSMEAGLGFLQATDIDYQVNGNDYTLSYKDSEGKVWSFDVKYKISGKDWMQCTLNQQEAESLYFEYVKTSYGYAAQYYSYGAEEDALYAISALNNYDGIIGVSATADKPMTLSENISPDFPKQCESWYSVQGDKGEAISADGTTFTFTALPAELE